LLAGILRLQTHTKNMWWFLVFCDSSCYANAPECYFMRTLPVLVLVWTCFCLFCNWL